MQGREQKGNLEGAELSTTKPKPEPGPNDKCNVKVWHPSAMRVEPESTTCQKRPKYRVCGKWYCEAHHPDAECSAWTERQTKYMKTITLTIDERVYAQMQSAKRFRDLVDDCVRGASLEEIIVHSIVDKVEAGKTTLELGVKGEPLLQ